MTLAPLWQSSDILTADSEHESDAPKRRGRIPQSAWPHILERYKAGETLTAIAREFDCTPSAISYIVRKAEAAQAGGEGESAKPAPAAPLLESLPSLADASAAAVARTPAPVAAAPRHSVAPTDPAAVLGEPGPDPVRESPRLEHRGDPPRPPRDQGFRHHRNGDRNGDLRPQGEVAPLSSAEAPPMEARPERGERFGQDRMGGDRGHDRPGRQPQFGQRRPGNFQPGQGRTNDPRAAEGRPGEGRSGDGRQGEGRQGEARDDRGNRFERSYQDQRPARSPAPADSGLEIDYVERPADAPYPYNQRQRNPARLEAAEVPTLPADQRMERSGQACADAYRAWKGNLADGGVQKLADALHELRKVIARMEIEISASRREELRPIPIPNYRLNQAPPQQPRGRNREQD